MPCTLNFQGYVAACKRTDEPVLEEKIVHGGHPVLHWMMDNICGNDTTAGVYDERGILFM